MDIEERIKVAIRRILSGHGAMRIPAEETDPDLVLADCLREIRRLRNTPEGYVLIPAEAVKQCACGCGRYCCTHCGTELGGFAARPEVP